SYFRNHRSEHFNNFYFSLIGGSDFKIIYRHYATLYFVFCVDSSESELGILDLIQVFVETLDKCFENVCELDLIFHMDKVCSIFQRKFNRAGISAAPQRAMSAVRNISPNLHNIPKPNINLPSMPSLPHINLPSFK
ncbi:PREDICTED: AP-3 complex subunit sigma-2-like, partial [Acropora digitifera]|uniref:AP-3 complex subunit sigma-2-like n=1 Tax=Acropora digitifera TaxID=70779 RepID=UPI00077A8A39